MPSSPARRGSPEKKPSPSDDVSEAFWLLKPPPPPPLTFFDKFTTGATKLFQGKFGPAISSTLGDVLSGGNVADAVERGLGLALSVGMNALIPGLGVLAGPLVSALSSLLGNIFGNIFGKTTAGDIVAGLTGPLSEALTAEIQTLGDQHGRDYGAAFRLSLDKVIGEKPPQSIEQLNFFLEQQRTILADADRGVISYAEGVGAITRSYAALMPFLADFGIKIADLAAPGGTLSDLVNRMKLGQVEAGELYQVFLTVAQGAEDFTLHGVEAMMALAREAGFTTEQIQALADAFGTADMEAAKASRQMRQEAKAVAARWSEAMDGLLLHQQMMVGDAVVGYREMSRVGIWSFDQVLDTLVELGPAGRHQAMEIVRSLEEMGVVNADVLRKMVKEHFDGSRLAAEAWSWWEGQTSDTVDRAERHNRQFFERIAEQMGLSAETAAAWVDGMLAQQRDAAKEYEKELRQTYRQQAIDAGLSEEQITEFVRANMKLQRQEERQAHRDRKNDRRERETEEIDSHKLVKDRALYFFDLMETRGLAMYSSLSGAAHRYSSSAFSGAPPAPVPGFAQGTGMQFLDFGTGRLAELHGPEAILNRGQGEDLAAMLRGDVRSELSHFTRGRGIVRDDRGADDQRSGAGRDLVIEVPFILDGRELDRRTVRVTKEAIATGRIPVRSDAIVQR